MVITLFGETVVKPGMEEREATIADKLYAILEAMPGFISMKSYRADDGEEIGIIRFDSRESLEEWMSEGEHAAAQKIGHEIYERFWIQTAETYREYTWDNGRRTEGDLTHLFAKQ
jgi:heme-degrading monooxygenase HmoA